MDYIGGGCWGGVHVSHGVLIQAMFNTWDGVFYVQYGRGPNMQLRMFI